MPQQLDISVIIPCYNANGTLARCIESVARQTSYPREIVIVDDGSDIPLEGLVEKLQSTIDVPIKFRTQHNRGAAAARNTALQLAVSQYVAFLDADDIWLPDKLRIQHELMEKHNLLLSGHGYAFDANELAQQQTLPAAKVRTIWRFCFILGNPLFTPTVMLRREHFSGFDERFRRVDDYKAWLEYFKADRCMMIDTVLAAGFKPPIGHSGLTGSIDRMHESYLEVLKALLDERRIGKCFYTMARLIEELKLPIRRYRSKK